MWILIIPAYAILIMYDFVPLYKQKQWREFAVNAVLGVLSLTAAVLLSFHVKIPSPAVPIGNWITSIFGK